MPKPRLLFLLVLLAFAFPLSGCMSQQTDTNDRDEDTPLDLPAPPGPDVLLLHSCDVGGYGGYVMREWVLPITPEGFEPDNDGFGTTSVAVDFMFCSRVEILNRTFENVAWASAQFGADVKNGTWGSNSTSVHVDLIIDDPGLVEFLNHLDIPAALGTVTREVLPGADLPVSFTAGWGSAAMTVRFADGPGMIPPQGMGVQEWTVNETAKRWDIEHSGGTRSVVYRNGASIELAGESQTHQMFGGLDRLPGITRLVNEWDYRITIAPGYEI